MKYAPADVPFMSEGSPDVAKLLTQLCAFVTALQAAGSKQVSRLLNTSITDSSCDVPVCMRLRRGVQTDCIIGYMMGMWKGCKGKPDGCAAVPCLTRQRAACAHAMGAACILAEGS